MASPTPSNPPSAAAAAPPPPPQPEAPPVTTTTLLISNIHCSSCTTTIIDLLSQLSPPPISVSTSIINHKVTITHPPSLRAEAIVQVLSEAEFEIDSISISTPQNEVRGGAGAGAEGAGNVVDLRGVHTIHYPGSWLDEAGERFREVVSYGKRKKVEVGGSGGEGEGRKHLENCELCRSEAAAEVDMKKRFLLLDEKARLVGDTATTDTKTTTIRSSEDYKSSVVVMEEEKEEEEEEERYPLGDVKIDRQDSPKPFEKEHQPAGQRGNKLYMATISIGGMTCASCSSRVTELLEALPWVKSASVNLMAHSGVIVFDGGAQGSAEEGAKKIVDEVEDSGYEANLEDLQSMGGEEGSSSPEEKSRAVSERKVALKIEGMFCDHCPAKIVEALKLAFPANTLTVESPPLTLASPILRITYRPHHPQTLTLRHIAAIISSVSPGKFSASVHHPPTIEERSRQLQSREQNRLLLRLTLCIIIAIPTFLIGIVWMTLVDKNDRIRIFLEKPIWAGQVTRTEWALLFLSSPVMFFVADVFHVRAFREIRALWRKGSSVPILRRFYKFGSMNLLISLGVSISYLASLALLVVSALREPEWDEMMGMGMKMKSKHITTYFDSTVFLTMFLLIGRCLEAYSKSKTADAVSMLGKLCPTEALLVVPINESEPNLAGAIEERVKATPIGDNDPSNTDYVDNRPLKTLKISADMLEVGDIISVVRGSAPPADGTIISGQSQFDESSLTGEARLVSKVEGDVVYAGTINQGQVVNVRVDSTSGSSMLDQIVKVVREGQTRRAPIERLADVITGYFVPVVTLIAIVTWLIWLSLGLSGALPDYYLDVSDGGWPMWSLSFAIAVFVIACPCGIGLAAPTALFVGSGLAAKFGILAKGGGEAFQEASWLDCVVFDKTGTLTQGGEPSVTDEMILVGDDDVYARGIVYAIAQRLEEASAHPLATAVVSHFLEKQKGDVAVVKTEEVPGRGLKGVFKLSSNDDVFEAIIGNEAFMEENNVIDLTRHENTLTNWKHAAKSVILLAIKKREGGVEDTSIFFNNWSFKLSALFAVADPIRPEAAEVVRCLKESGVGVWMISGDNRITATAVAGMVGIEAENVIAGVLPTQKAEKIHHLQTTAPLRQKSHLHRIFNRTKKPHRAIVAMVGDGINDAPALTTADVGIAIGSGSDIAIGSAKFILMSSDLRSLITLMDLSRAVFRRVKFNFLWACVYNLCALPIAAGVVYPFGGVRLGPVWAALSMALSSVSVVCSSLFLKTRLPGVGFRRKDGRD